MIRRSQPAASCSARGAHGHSTLTVTVSGPLEGSEIFTACHGTDCTCTACRAARSSAANPLGDRRHA